MITLFPVLMLAARAGAADASEPVELRWTRGQGAESCADSQTLERRVEARLGREVFREHAPRVLVASVQRTATEYVARLHFEEGSKRTAARALRSRDEDCAALEAAVVLAAAIAIDARSALAAPAPAASTPAQLVPAAPAAGPAPEQLPASAPPPAAPPASREPPLPVPPRALGMAATLRAYHVAGLLPDPAWGVGLHVNREIAARWSLELGMRFLPAVRTADERYEFGFTGVSLGGCFEVMAPLDVCAGVLGGAVHATTRNGLAGDTGQHPFVLPELGPRAAGALGPLRWELGVSVGTPLLRPNFLNEDDTLKTGPLTFSAFAGIGPKIP